MIIKGNIRGSAKQFGNYLVGQGENEHVEVFGIEGCTSDTVPEAIMEMSLAAELCKTEKVFDHIQICPHPSEAEYFTRKSWQHAIDVTLKHQGYTGQPYVATLHKKKDRTHLHLGVQRYDFNNGRIIPNRYSRYRRSDARAEIEKDLGLLRTPKKNSQHEVIRKDLSELWQICNPREFIKQAAIQGYAITKGGARRPFMVVDEKGRSFDLMRKIKTKGMRLTQSDLHKAFRGIVMMTDKEAIEKIRAEQDRQKRLIFGKDRDRTLSL